MELRYIYKCQDQTMSSGSTVKPSGSAATSGLGAIDRDSAAVEGRGLAGVGDS